jgi:hypothetical protein
VSEADMDAEVSALMRNVASIRESDEGVTTVLLTSCMVRERLRWGWLIGGGCAGLCIVISTHLHQHRPVSAVDNAENGHRGQHR